MGMKILVASTISSRVVSCLIARPTISSEVPAPYALAVSQKVMPRSSAWRNSGCAASSCSAHGCHSLGVPKLMQPSVIRLIFSPEIPRLV